MSDMDLDAPFSLTPSPSSSPPSSPAFGTADSSPPSSPSIAPVATPPASPGPSDPYAGSTKAIKRPRLYEKRTLGWGGSSQSTGGFGARDHSDATAGDDPKGKRVLGHGHSHSTESASSNSRGYAYTRTSSQVVDPFAASAKAQWKPPRREKKFSRVVSNDSVLSTSSMFSDEDASSLHESTIEISDLALTDVEDSHDPSLDIGNKVSHGILHVSSDRREEERWEEAITNAIDSANGIIDLSVNSILAAPLTYIPPSIADLAGLVVLSPDQAPPRNRAFTRSITVPALYSRSKPFFADEATSNGPLNKRSQPLIKAASSAGLQPAAAPSQSEIQLFLAGNVFRALPVELFQLSGLTVLSLRRNNLRVLPPQIAQLTNLRELNVAFNELRWLPAEMLGMQLTALNLSGNPWLQNTDQTADNTKHSNGDQANERKETSLASRRITHFTIPTLTELCLRVLLAPVRPQMVDEAASERMQTLLEASYTLPLSETSGYPSSVLEILRSCLPVAVAKPAQLSPAKKPRKRDTDDVHTRRGAVHSYTPQSHGSSDGIESDDCPPGIGVCPSPAHRTGEGAWVDGRVPVFVQYGEERITWERVVAGLKMGAECGPDGVPVRWRGCSRDCLVFLNEGVAEEVEKADGQDVEMMVDADAGNSHDDGDGARVVDLSAGGLADMEDFD